MVSENPNACTDTVLASVNYTLGDAVENLALTGAARSGTGNALNNVIIGNAPEVRLLYNDHEFDLEPHTKVAVARFTVE